jgi:hypothetical protein
MNYPSCLLPFHYKFLKLPRPGVTLTLKSYLGYFFITFLPRPYDRKCDPATQEPCRSSSILEGVLLHPSSQFSASLEPDYCLEPFTLAFGITLGIQGGSAVTGGLRCQDPPYRPQKIKFPTWF